METKTIFLFNSIWDWSIVVFLFAISGLILQLACDFYLTIFDETMPFGGWGWASSALLLSSIIIILFVLMTLEIISVIKLILLQKKSNVSIRLYDDHAFGSIVLLPASVLFTLALCFFSCIDAAIYDTRIADLSSEIVDFYGFIPNALGVIVVILSIVIIVKNYIFIFWADKEKTQ